MTPDEQQTAIARACEWKDCDINWLQKPALLLGSKPTFHNGKIISYLVDQIIPHYPSDLNACHEMEQVLTAAQLTVYRNTLALMNGGIFMDDGGSFVDLGFAVSATAAQRAEAFLRTLELWTATPTQPQ
jgi:hypothetical protein